MMLVCIILEGTTISSTIISTATCQAALTISQLITFNSVKWKRRESTTFVRHAVSQETPLPVYLGLMIHSSLVDTLSSMGLSISYNRVDEIQTTLKKKICYKYQTDQLVRPPTLVDNSLTTAAIDNVDHNATSNTTSDHFHGTYVFIPKHRCNKRCACHSRFYMQHGSITTDFRITELLYGHSSFMQAYPLHVKIEMGLGISFPMKITLILLPSLYMAK